MRVSADRKDPAFSEDAIDGRYTVKFGGEPVKWCITADDEKNEILIYSTDDQGRAIQTIGGLKTEWLSGKVEIVDCMA